MFGYLAKANFSEEDVQTLKTTRDRFQKELHAYTITHAIEDRNVLRFHVDYYKPEGAEIKPGETLAKRAVVEAILAKHDAATGGRRFNALLATASINDAIECYGIFDAIQNGRQLAGPAFVPAQHHGRLLPASASLILGKATFPLSPEPSLMVSAG